MRLNKKCFFEEGCEYDDPDCVEEQAFNKMCEFVEINKRIKIINIERREWGNGEEYILYYEDNNV